jgi:hypothetical protein
MGSRGRKGKKGFPALIPCPDVTQLQALSPEEARQHVNTYLHDVMSREDADAFAALSYRWELHLVPLHQLCLLRKVKLSARKRSYYRSVIRRGDALAPLVGLGGEGQHITENVLLCDGYHRVMAMSDLGLHFAWIWLATGLFERPAACVALSSTPALLASDR